MNLTRDEYSIILLSLNKYWNELAEEQKNEIMADKVDILAKKIEDYLDSQ